MSVARPVVLIVEDDVGTARLLQELLEPAGYTVEWVAEGLRALERTASGGVDVVLLDLMLPDLSGLELCRQIRSREGGAHLPVIMLTALGSDRQRHVGFAAGADDYVTKPFDIQELLDRVAVWTRASRRATVAPDAAETVAPSPAPHSGTLGPAGLPSFQETLRTLGGLLDQTGARVAHVALTPGAAQLRTYREVQRHRLGQRELAQEIAARRARRGRSPRLDPTSPARYEALLRAVGVMLDAEPDHTYDVVVTPRQIMVESPAAGPQVFTVEQLAALLRVAVHGREPPWSPEP